MPGLGRRQCSSGWWTAVCIALLRSVRVTGMHGYEHTTLNLAVFAPLAATGLFYGRMEGVLTFGAGYLIGTLLITPDLDLRYNDAARRWGLLRVLWAPYHLMSKHRGMSHTYVLGPLTRLLYISAWLWPVAYLFRPETVNWDALLWPAVQVIAGYVVAQWLHLMADGIWPFMPARVSGRRS